MRTDREMEQDENFSEQTKVDLLMLVMTGKIKREDYLKCIKED